MKEVSSTRRPSRLEISGSQVVYRLNSVKQWRCIQSAPPQWMYLSTCWSESSSSSYNATDVTHRIRLKFSSLVRLLRNKTFNKTHSHRQSSRYSDYDIDTNQQSRTMELKLTMKNRQKEQKDQKERWSLWWQSLDTMGSSLSWLHSHSLTLKLILCGSRTWRSWNCTTVKLTLLEWTKPRYWWVMKWWLEETGANTICDGAFKAGAPCD